METREEIQRVLSHYPKWAGVDANTSMVYNARLTARDERYVRETIERLARMNQLAVNADYAQAYRTFFNVHPDLALEGNMKIFDEALLEQSEAVTAESLEELLDPGNPYNVLDQISITAEASQSQAEEQERQSLITKIVGGLKTSIDGNGRKVCAGVEGHLVIHQSEVQRIKSLGLDELRRIDADRAETQRLRSLPKEELRQVVRDNAPAMPSRYQPVPDLYYPPGKVEGLAWSFQLFKRLPTQEQKRLLRIHGNDNLTAAIAAGRS